jgi:hypothetical protein
VGHKGSWAKRDLGCGLAAWSPLFIFTCMSVQRELAPGGPGSGLRQGRRRFLLYRLGRAKVCSVVASSCLDIFNGAALLLTRKDHRWLRNEGPSQCPYFLVRAGDEESAKLRCCFELSRYIQRGTSSCLVLKDLRARHSIYSMGHDFLLDA